MGSFSVRFSTGLVMRFGAYRVVIAGQLAAALALFLLAFGPEPVVYARELLRRCSASGAGSACRRSL